MDPDALPILAIVGPTGTGKSALSIALARRLRGEVVNADSMQLYRGMDIGTAKVTAAERQGVPHHLLDVLELEQEASVADYQTAARRVFAQIRGRGSVPILVGGSGLYVRAALDRIEFPGTDPRVRRRLERELAERGPGPLRARLHQVDPDSARRVRDDRRLVRALEVHEVTGRPFTAFMPRREHVLPALQIGLDLPREQLHARLEQRVRQMVDQGLVQEVRDLLDRGLESAPTASRALGYPQFTAAVRGESSVEQAVQATATATRQFAKRQLTWFRADDRVRWLGASSSSLVEDAVDLVRAETERAWPADDYHDQQRDGAQRTQRTADQEDR